MCRLYALHATHPTHAACELLDAQNALIQQSRQDGRGLANPDGWGMARLLNGEGRCFRQVEPASQSATYRNEALQLNGTLLMAHVRRATVGTPAPTNTHPFRHRDAFLIHNGHIPAFDEVRPRLCATLSEERQAAIQGTTDSEHVLALLLQLRADHPDAAMDAITEKAIDRLRSWCDAASAPVQTEVSDVAFGDLTNVPEDVLHGTLALNILWTDGETLGGARYNRTLWYTERMAPYLCPICGNPHADVSGTDAPPYRATVLASERITDEAWHAVPNGSVFSVEASGTLSHRTLVAA
jgi:predicted glutamine amidotransferase